MKTFPSLILFFLCMPAFAEMRTDIEFAKPDGFSLKLDASIPDGLGPFPTVIIVHGGGFTAGNKQTYVKPLFEPLTKNNFAWFSIDYRLAPQHQFPAAVQDVEAAIRYVKKHAREFKVDPKRIALVGESAGGYLVSYVCVTGKGATRVSAVVPFYGPHDLETRARKSGTISEGLKGFLGITELNAAAFKKLHEVSPINHVKKGLPPFLLIHGTKDPLVPYEQSVLMREKLIAAGNRCDLFTIEEGAHGMGGWKDDAYKTKLVEWLGAVLDEKTGKSGK